MVTPHLPPYQAANAILPDLLGAELEKRGHTVSFLTFEANEPRRPRTAYVRRRRGPRVTRVPQLLEAFETKRLARPMVEEADVVHIHSNTWMNQVAARMAVRSAKPYVLTHYGTEIWHHDGKNRAFRNMNAAAAHVTFYSQALFDRARELMVPFSSGSVEYPAVSNVFHPLSFGEREAIRAEWLNGAAQLVLNVKRLHPLADQATLIRAFALLRERSLSACLLIAGSGDEEQALRALISEHQLEKSVRLLGLVPNETVAKLQAAADVFALSSKLEATPTVVLEALACGTRVVSTDNPGGIELQKVFPGDVVVVPREDPQALASALMTALGENRRASSATEATIAARFRFTGLVDRHLRIYETAIRSLQR